MHPLLNLEFEPLFLTPLLHASLLVFICAVAVVIAELWHWRYLSFALVIIVKFNDVWTAYRLQEWDTVVSFYGLAELIGGVEEVEGAVMEPGTVVVVDG